MAVWPYDNLTRIRMVFTPALLSLHPLSALRAVFASAVADLAMSLETNKSDFQHYIDW